MKTDSTESIYKDLKGWNPKSGIWWDKLIAHANMIERYNSGDILQPLTELMYRLRKILDSYHLHNPTVSLNTEAIIKSVEIDITLTGNEICEIVLNKIYASDQTAIHSSSEIKTIKVPQRKDDWFIVIDKAIRCYEDEFSHTPSKDKLWHYLSKESPSGWDVIYKNNCLCMAGSKPLDRENFNKRYTRYYPPTS